MKDRRSYLSLASACVIGIVVMILVNQMGHGGDLLSLPEYLTLKGVLYGCGAGFVAYGLTWIIASSHSARSWAMLGMVIMLAAIGFTTLLWMAAVGIPPLFTLEGAWLWPLTVVPLILSFVSLKRWRRMKML